MKASAIAAEKRPAPRTFKLEPSDFADTWGSRPPSAVAVGMRLISDAEESEARKVASEAAGALEAGPAVRLDEYNDTLVAGIVGAALCDPNDLRRDPSEIPCPRDMLRSALTSRAIRRLFYEYDLLASDLSPAAPMADDDALVAIVEAIAEAPEALTSRARRLLAAVLDEIDSRP